jgi:hypothetical protein
MYCIFSLVYFLLKLKLSHKYKIFVCFFRHAASSRMLKKFIVKLMYFADVYFVSTDTPNHEKYCFCNSLIWFALASPLTHNIIRHAALLWMICLGGWGVGGGECVYKPGMEQLRIFFLRNEQLRCIWEFQHLITKPPQNFWIHIF